MEGVNCIHLAQESKKCRAFLNTQNVDNFLSSCGTVNFVRNTSLHGILVTSRTVNCIIYLHVDVNKGFAR